MVGGTNSNASQHGQEGLLEMMKLLDCQDLSQRLRVRDALLRLPPKSIDVNRTMTLLDEPYALARLTGLKMLAKLPFSALLPELGNIIARLEDEDGDVRRAIVELIKKCPAEALIEHCELLVSLTSHTQWPVRVTALYACALLPSEVLALHLENIMGNLQHEEPTVRWAAVDVLRHLPSNISGTQAAKLIPRLADPERYVRWAAIGAVASMPTESLEPLMDRLTANLSSPQACARGITAIAMCRLESSLVLPYLRILALRLRDDEQAVRWATLHGLRKLPIEALATQEYLIQEVAGRVMEDPDIWVRKAACRLLETMPEDSLPSDVRAAMDGIWSQHDEDYEGGEGGGESEGAIMREWGPESSSSSACMPLGPSNAGGGRR